MVDTFEKKRKTRTQPLWRLISTVTRRHRLYDIGRLGQALRELEDLYEPCLLQLEFRGKMHPDRILLDGQGLKLSTPPSKTCVPYEWKRNFHLSVITKPRSVHSEWKIVIYTNRFPIVPLRMLYHSNYRPTGNKLSIINCHCSD